MLALDKPPPKIEGPPYPRKYRTGLYLVIAGPADVVEDCPKADWCAIVDDIKVTIITPRNIFDADDG
jgi:hypothetical protein